MAINAAWSDVIRSNWANVQLFMDLRTGNYQDLSDNARVVTLTPWPGLRPPQWLNQTAGKGMEMGGVVGGSGFMTTPNTAPLNLNPSGTIMCFWRSEFPLFAGNRFAWKRTGGATSYDLYDLNGAGALGMYDGTTSHVLGTFTRQTTRSVGATFAVGVRPIGYSNGNQLTTSVALWNPNWDNGVLSLPGSAGLVNPNTNWWCWLLFSTILTNAEIAQLHSDFMNSAHIF